MLHSALDLNVKALGESSREGNKLVAALPERAVEFGVAESKCKPVLQSSPKVRPYI